MRRVIIAVVLGLSALAPALAIAQKASPQVRAEAERFFRAGERAYNAGQYVAAAQAFEEAWKRLPLPAIAFSAAQAYRLQYFIDKDPARLKRAIQLYREYIAQTPQGGRRDDAVTSLAELEPILARIEEDQRKKGMGPVADMPRQKVTTQLMVTTQVEGARASIGDAEPAPAPLIREVAPGNHKVAVTAEGYFPVEQTATAVEGRLVVVEVELSPRPAIVTLRAEAGAQVLVDGRAVGTTPLRPLELDAGTHLISVSRRGRRAWAREITVARGDEVTLHAALQTTTQRKVSYWVLGASVVTLAGAGVYGFMAAGDDGDASDLLALRDERALTPDEVVDYQAAVDRRDDRRSTMYTLLGVGGAMAVTGTLLYFIDTPSPEAPRTTVVPRATAGDSDGVAMVPLIGPELTGIGLTGRF